MKNRRADLTPAMAELLRDIRGRGGEARFFRSGIMAAASALEVRKLVVMDVLGREWIFIRLTPLGRDLDIEAASQSGYEPRRGPAMGSKPRTLCPRCGRADVAIRNGRLYQHKRPDGADWCNAELS